MGRFKRSKRKPKGLKLKFTIAEIPVWLDVTKWEFEKQWREAQMKGGIRLINSK